MVMKGSFTWEARESDDNAVEKRGDDVEEMDGSEFPR